MDTDTPREKLAAHVSFRASTTVVQRLLAIGEAEDRSLAYVVRRTVEEALDLRDAQPEVAAQPEDSED